MCNSKSPARTSLYQGAKQCQTTLLLEQLAGVSPAFNATPSQRELASSAVPPLQREEPSAASMVELQQAQRQSKADSVAPKQRLSTALKREKREPNGLKQCVGFVHSRTLVMRWGSCPDREHLAENQFNLFIQAKASSKNAEQR